MAAMGQQGLTHSYLFVLEVPLDRKEEMWKRQLWGWESKECGWKIWILCSLGMGTIYDTGQVGSSVC